jgi:hypothetical protein
MQPDASEGELSITDIGAPLSGTLLMVPVRADPDTPARVRGRISETFSAAVSEADGTILAFVATELLWNAISHGSEPIRLMVHVDGHRALVAAFDGRPDAVPVRHESPDHGLGRIDALTRGAWVTIPSDAGKWVAASLPLDTLART